MADQHKTRAYVFTHFIAEHTGPVWIWPKDSMDYYGYAVERTEDNRLHMQGMVVFKSRKLWSVARNQQLIKGAHIEKMMGTFKQAHAYFADPASVRNDQHPEGKPPYEDLFEYGTLPKQATGCKREHDYRLVEEAARAGNFDEIPSSRKLAHYASLKAIRSDFLTTRHLDNLATMDNYWIYGETGAGKSHYVHQKYPDAYKMMMGETWWTGYDDQDTVYIEDVDPKLFGIIGAGHFKQWADLYPFMANCKYGQQKIRPKRIVVTSQYAIDEMPCDSRDKDALRRRFQVLKAWYNKETKERGLTLVESPLE